MNIEKALDEMQGSLTKLREGIRKLGIAGTASDDPIGMAFHKVVKDYAKEVDEKIMADLPLNARVAKALGLDITRCEPMFNIYRYRNKDGLHCPIPDYANDLIAAMGALWEYSKKPGVFNVGVWIKESGYHLVEINRYFSGTRETGIRSGSHNSLPQAICLAIVEHAERK